MESETYVRRRRWSWAAKRLVVEEAEATGNVLATAKRHGLQAQQIYRWRERLAPHECPTAFLPVTVDPTAGTERPALMLDHGRRDPSPAAVLDRGPRIELVLGSGCRIIVQGAVDADMVLKLARGLGLSR